MTAEIAIMNKMAVALAADSAVTIETGGQVKIYNSNKLFMLSRYHPVGIMIFNSAEIMRVPWESIIKSYRRELGETGYDTLEEYGHQFIAHLDKNATLFPESEQQEYFYRVLEKYLLSMVREPIDDAVRAVTQKGQKVTATQIKSITAATIKGFHDFLERQPPLKFIPTNFEQDVRANYSNVIEAAIKNVFRNLPLSTDSKKRLRQICANLVVKEYKEPIYSGVVIAGFGKTDLFPRLVSYQLEGVVNNTLRYKPHITSSVDRNVSATIIPFAQDEMVHAFMQGVDPAYLQVLLGYLREFFRKYHRHVAKLSGLSPAERKEFTKRIEHLGDSMLEDLIATIHNYSREAHVNPVANTVEFLPLTELALMAESLVNLTSFKRRITMEAETVGGPIDVAVISKADGFIWIKRKRYFEATANNRFYANYFR